MHFLHPGHVARDLDAKTTLIQGVRGDFYFIFTMFQYILSKIVVKKCGSYICRNDNFYDNGKLNTSLFDDGVHVKDLGITKLAKNIKMAICDALNKEVVQKKKIKRVNYRHRRGFFEDTPILDSY